jgi:hypothetical protein
MFISSHGVRPYHGYRSLGWNYSLTVGMMASLLSLTGSSMDHMVLDVGFELTTYRLQGGCSTPELIQRQFLISAFALALDHF